MDPNEEKGWKKLEVIGKCTTEMPSLYQEPSLPLETMKALKRFSNDLYTAIRDEFETNFSITWAFSKDGFLLDRFSMNMPTEKFESWLDKRWVEPFTEAQHLPKRRMFPYQKNSFDSYEYTMCYRLFEAGDLTEEELKKCRTFVAKYRKMAPHIMDDRKEMRFANHLNSVEMSPEERIVTYAELLGKYIVEQMNEQYSEKRAEALKRLLQWIDNETVRIERLLSMNYGDSDYSLLIFEQEHKIFSVKEMKVMIFEKE